MKSRYLIEVHQVFSILLFSLLANFIFELNFDFNASLDPLLLLKLTLLTFASYWLYFRVVIFLIGLREESQHEYFQSNDESWKASNPIDKLFANKLKKQKSRYSFAIFAVGTAFALFLFVESFHTLLFE